MVYVVKYIRYGTLLQLPFDRRKDAIRFSQKINSMPETRTVDIIQFAQYDTPIYWGSRKGERWWHII